MIGRMFRKALRISRGLALAIGAVVISAVVLGAATTALAAAPGDPFRLGKVNVINKVTKLVGKANSPRLVIDNNGNGVALSLQVKPGRPPMQVNSTRKVARLNADRLDNLDQSAFLRKNGKAVDADRLDGKGSGDFLPSGVYQKIDSSTGKPNGLSNAKAMCDSGDSVLSGGFDGINFAETLVYTSRPIVFSDGSQGWYLGWRSGPNADTVQAEALCADTTP